MKIVIICFILMLGHYLINAQILAYPGDKPVGLCDDPNEYFCGPNLGCKPCCQDSHCPTQYINIGGGQINEVERYCRYSFPLINYFNYLITLLAFYIGTINV